MRVQKPEVIARATEHIPRMVELVEKLAAAGAAYKADDGSWYFRLSAFPEYGKLSKKDLSGIEDGARVDVDEYEKDSARDFALWKAAKPGETSWETAIGRGRPGWHIECSAMAMEYLGESFDLHAGGEDLMFPHHENEIAQSESVRTRRLPGTGCMCASCSWTGARCRRAKGTSIRSAICCSRDTRRRPSGWR